MGMWGRMRGTGARSAGARSRRWLIAVAVVALVVPLAACNDDATSGSAQADAAALTTTTTTGTSDTEPTSPEGTTDAEPTSETTSIEQTTVAVPPPPASTPAPDPEPGPIDPDSDDRFTPDDEWDVDGPKELIVPDEDEALTDEECLLGTWYFSNAVFNNQLQQMVGGAANTDVSGRAKVTFYPDGTVTTMYDAWTVTGDNIEGGGSFTMVRNGTDQGTYTADEGLMTMQDTSLTSQIDLTIEAAGQVMQMQAPPAELERQEVVYMCFPLILTITDAEGYMSIMGRPEAFQ